MAEQMLIDCGMGDCNGGWADRAFDTIKTQVLDIIPTMSRILESKNLLNPSTTMDPTLFMFMPTATSNVITVESLTILAAHKALITMLLSMLVMTNLKDTGPSEIPGLVDGEKMVTSE